MATRWYNYIYINIHICIIDFIINLYYLISFYLNIAYVIIKGEWKFYNNYWSCCFTLDKNSIYCSPAQSKKI
jgi:hypothetical protein